MKAQLLPEEDALDDPDEDGEADPTLPGDLWFRVGFSRARRKQASRRERGRIVYSRRLRRRAEKTRNTVIRSHSCETTSRKRTQYEW
jgi:hypothetical protein